MVEYIQTPEAKEIKMLIRSLDRKARSGEGLSRDDLFIISGYIAQVISDLDKWERGKK